MAYSPAMAALVARVTLQEGIKDVSFRFRGAWIAQAILIGWLWPALSGCIVYGTSWILGFTRFEWTSAGYPYSGWGPESLVGLSVVGMSTTVAFVVRLTACLLFSLVLCAQTLGEELGWRGYMLTRLFDAKIPAPVFWNGLVWGLWHIPFIASASNGQLRESRWISGSFFVAGAIAAAYLLSYLRLRSGSIWPAVLAHASANAVFGLAFDGFTAANPLLEGRTSFAERGFTGARAPVSASTLGRQLLAESVAHGGQPPLIAGVQYRTTCFYT